MPQDSTGNELCVGDKVRCRGKVYTVKRFSPVPREVYMSTYTVHYVYFEEPWEGDPADETMVDIVCPLYP